ncbi:MAG TPA: hypothetical protein DCY13_04005 [Verrucomicrobiales bacterium]|nr:hypothetical protein [Verrucomicrobiales bacterium]
MARPLLPSQSHPSSPTTLCGLLLGVTLLTCTALTATALGTTFTYQGRLLDGGAPGNGLYDFQFTLHDGPAAGAVISSPITRDDVPVTNGLFTVELDFGPGAFDGGTRWLAMAARAGTNTGGYLAIPARQALHPLPQSQFAQFAQSAGSVPDGTITAAMVVSNTFLELGGNATGSRLVFGTTDAQPLELLVNGTPGLRLEPSTNTHNFVGGFSNNYVAPGIVGSVIVGGGGQNSFTQTENLRTNAIEAHYGFVGGGAGNQILGAGTNKNDYGVIVGGLANTTIGSFQSFIGGGIGNAITNSFQSAIVGGCANYISDASQVAFIGNGWDNIIHNGYYGMIGSGIRNLLISNRYSTIVSGENHKILEGADRSFIGGGSGNIIEGTGATISGGNANKANGKGTTIGGGSLNIANGAWATISGGNVNSASGDFAMVPGGKGNAAIGKTSFAAGNQAKADHDGAFVWADSVTNDFASTSSNQFSVRATGGVRFETDGAGATLDGRPLAVLGAAPSGSAMTLGTADNHPIELHANNYAALRLIPTDHFGAPNVILGHRNNSVSNGVVAATISGGGTTTEPNIVGGHFSTIGGGGGNVASGFNTTVGGGSGNIASGDYSTIGGGYGNTSSGASSVVPGGDGNVAAGDTSFAAGSSAKANHTGTFVWADATTGSFASTSTNQFLIRASGGVGIGTTDPQGALDIAVADGQRLQFRYENDLVPGLNVKTTGDYPGILRLRNALEIWPDDTAARAGKLDVRNAAGNITVSADGQSGNVTAVSFSPTSDRNAKENFAPVDARAVLAQVANLPISRWSFKSDPSVAHIGPMAQDFHSTFNVGIDEKHISTVDADGVALAAIQGLNQVVDEKNKEIEILKHRLHALEQIVFDLSKGRQPLEAGE